MKDCKIAFADVFVVKLVFFVHTLQSWLRVASSTRFSCNFNLALSLAGPLAMLQTNHGDGIGGVADYERTLGLSSDSANPGSRIY